MSAHPFVMKNHFKTNLKYLLGVHNMTSADLAARLNISPPAISKWLNPSNDVSPTLENLLSLSDIFNTSLDVLIKEDLQNGMQTQANERSIPDRIESAIMALERLRNDIKKGGGTRLFSSILLLPLNTPI